MKMDMRGGGANVEWTSTFWQSTQDILSMFGVKKSQRSPKRPKVSGRHLYTVPGTGEKTYKPKKHHKDCDDHTLLVQFPLFSTSRQTLRGLFRSVPAAVRGSPAERPS